MNTPRVRVSAIVINNDQILLIHRKKDGKEYWVFPGGGVEADETVQQAAAREVLEETSLIVTGFGESFDFENMGGIHPAIFCTVNFAQPSLGNGNEINTPDDWYNPEWVDIKLALSFTNLFPEAVVEHLRSKYEYK